jgi:outer membrane receptor protein involved in Fe transport
VHKDVNTDELYSLRTALKFIVNDQLTITPSVWYQLLKEGGPSNYDVPTGESGGPLVQNRPFDISEAYTDRAILSNLTLNYALGFGNIISSTSFMHRVVVTPDDESEALELNIPQGQFVPNAYTPRVTTREFTEELRLAIAPEGSPFNGVAGVYYNDANRHYSVDFLTPNYATLFANTYATQTLLSGVPLSDVNYSQSGDYAPKQSAVFAEGNYNLTTQLKLTAGLRWYDLEYTTVRHEDGWSNGGPSLSDGSAKNTGINPKVSLSYQIDADALVYTTASRGVRPGGVNTSDLAAKGCGQDYGPYQPDSLWNYEAGGKTRWFGGALIANGAAYYIKWKNVQQGLTLPCSYQITEGAGAATVRGAELELQSQIGRHLLLTGGAAYTKATLDQDAPNLNGVAGEQLQNVPLWNASASAKYSFQPAPHLDAFARVDAQYVGNSFPDFDHADPATFQRSYSLFDLRAGLLWGGWETDLFLDNVTDKHAAISRFISDNYDASSRSRMFTNRPRTLGISVQKSF